MIRILGIDTAFNGMTVEVYIPLTNIQRFSRSYFYLGTHQINTSNSLSNTMFYLNSWIDFHKVELVIGQIQEKLHGANIGVMNAFSCLDRQQAYFLPHSFGKGNGGRFLKQLLIPALDGAFTLPKMYNGAVVISYHLYLDMAGTLNIMFKIEFGFGYIHNLENFL